MDSLGSLALATEPPYEELLNRKPTNRKEFIINGRMWKHIILQALVEIILLLLLYIYAPKFIPETKEDINKASELILYCFKELPGGGKQNTTNIIDGRKDKWSDNAIFNNATTSPANCSVLLSNEWQKKNNSLSDAFDFYRIKYGGTTHMTFIFDTFVIYTLFNQINCRIIDDSLNTFTRIGHAILFICVTAFELIVQISISQISIVGYVFHCVKGGLSLEQWGICLGFSLSTMVFNFIFKLIPLEKLIDPFTKPKSEAETSDTKASTTISEMVNQRLLDA
jgi:magnesium-transporting ATPase (P-type)